MAQGQGTMRLRHALIFASLSLAATGCGAQLKREVVGSGGAAIQLRGEAAGTVPATQIQLGRGNYDIALTFDVPRAQVVDFELVCAGLPVRSGQVGETFEAYRTRRLAQLRAQMERDRRAVASVTGAVVGAVAPTVHAQGQVSTPTATTTVDAQVSGQASGAAAGQAVAQQAFPEITELPPGDVGRGRLATNIHIGLGAPDTCTLTATAEDAHVLVGYQVTHIRNLDQEARERRIAAEAKARDVRIELTAQLTVAGADPLALQKRRDAEARARAHAEAERLRIAAEADAERARLRAIADAEREQRRAEEDARRATAQAERDARRDRDRVRADSERAEREAQQARARAEYQAKLDLELRMKLEIEGRREESVRHTRTLLLAYLAGECHADPHKRERERQAEALRIRLELDAKAKLELRLRMEREAKLRIKLETEARLRAEREARDAKLRAEREAREAFERDQRAAREAKLRYEREQRAAFELEQRRIREEAEQRRFEIALNVRASLRAQLVSMGARERPPMPALIAENPGMQPFDGAVWITGTWSWTGGQWIWSAGGWQDQSRFGDSGSSGVVVRAQTTVEVPVSTTVTTSTTTTTSTSASSGVTVTGGASTSTGAGVTVSLPPLPTGISVGGSVGGSAGGSINVRDHRTPKATTGSGPTVRDHRR